MPQRLARKLAPIIVLVSGSFLVSSCTRESTPRGVVIAFLEAGKSGDRSGVLDRIQKRDRLFLETMRGIGGKGAPEGVFAPPEGAEFHVGQPTTDGGKGTVMVTTIQDRREKKDTLRLVREDGRWKIDLVPDEMIDMLEDSRKLLEGAAGPKGVTGR